jgi:hypothetical protein
MNRRLTQFHYALEKMPVTLYVQFSVGATGAPTLNALSSLGVASITRNSAGQYTVLLQEPMVRLLSVDAQESNATGISASPNMAIVSGSTNINSLAAPQVTVQFSSGGAATDIASGSLMTLQIVASNTTAI